jgi:cyclophilin family peptidyl-prolyl cis-trans isomerase
MSNNYKKVRETARQRRQARQRTVQIITVAVIAIIGITLIWAIVSSRLSQKTTAAATSTGACQVSTLQFTSAPAMQIDTSKQYFATVKMVKGGEFVIQLYPDKAPLAVNSFVFLARKGYFNCVTFHRVIDGFMAQGGDPTGSGMGGPGYSFANEANELAFDKPGVVAMANAGRDTNGSQFFIMFVPYGLSENDYTIFGQIISGMEVVNGLTRRDPNQSPNFSGDVMESVTITEK